jgi:hypothetical protein
MHEMLSTECAEARSVWDTHVREARVRSVGQSRTVRLPSSPPSASSRPSPLKARHLATGCCASTLASSPARRQAVLGA